MSHITVYGSHFNFNSTILEVCGVPTKDVLRHFYKSGITYLSCYNYLTNTKLHNTLHTLNILHNFAFQMPNQQHLTNTHAFDKIITCKGNRYHTLTPFRIENAQSNCSISPFGISHHFMGRVNKKWCKMRERVKIGFTPLKILIRLLMAN